MAEFAVLDDPIDPATLQRGLAGPGVGAVVCFEGRVRDRNDGRPVNGLAYQAYLELAQAEGGRIMAEAHAKFPIVQAVCVHRVGELAVGELAVFAAVAAAHRDAAFAACRYVIDEVKARVPIWKREHYADGAPAWLHPDAG